MYTELPHSLQHTHAAQLLQSVYDDLTPDPRVLDITVEDPSDEFRALRDFVDCRNALKMACFQPPAVHEGFGREMERECNEKLKLHKVRGVGGEEEGGEEEGGRGGERERGGEEEGGEEERCGGRRGGRGRGEEERSGGRGEKWGKERRKGEERRKRGGGEEDGGRGRREEKRRKQG